MSKLKGNERSCQLRVNGRVVSAYAAAGKLLPPGWTPPDENGKAVSVSDLSKRDQGQFSRPSFVVF